MQAKQDFAMILKRIRERRMARGLSGVLFIGLPALALMQGSWAYAVPGNPSYAMTFQDAVTGDNQFIGPNGKHAWFINSGADSYFDNVYERPTVQNYEYITAVSKVGNDPELVVGNSYSATGFSSPAYFGYLDIVNGRYGYNNQFMYFQIELFSVNAVGNDGSITAKFGDGTVYRVRIGGDENGAGGLMLSGEAGADYTKAEYQAWNTQKAFAYLDVNRDVGGPGGITTVNENPGSMNGYEFKSISDGKIELGNKPDVLYTRYLITDDGRPAVEFAFDYVTYNAFFSDYLGSGHPNKDYSILPESLLYIDYEANRSLKDQSNYLWNDKYSFSQAGTPYDPLNEPQNIYELDTLRGVVPEPITLVFMMLGGLALLLQGRRAR